MKYFQILSVALCIGALASACAEPEQCYECTATDPNGVGSPVSSELCEEDLTNAEKAAFAASFAVQHDPTLYNIDCQDK